MGYGFEVAGVPRIMSATMAANTASRRVMDKCGLRFQGELHLPGTVMVWYAVDRCIGRPAKRRPDCDSPGGAPARPP